MCGIAGALELAPRVPAAAGLADIVIRMRDEMLHRGPDAAGAWSDEQAGVHLAHRRLAIVDLTDHGRQPMSFAAGRFHIVFNGEIYNFRDLAAELEGRGHHFTSSGDTQVLLAAIAEWGVERALQRVVGMFAFALWDRHEATLHLARDRMGEKPLHFGVIDGVLYFASELRAFRAVPRFASQVSREALASYLRFGYVPEPLSMHEGVCKLPPGTMLSVPHRGGVRLDTDVAGWMSGARATSAGVAPRRYWSCHEAALAGVERQHADEREASAEFESLLRRAVRQQMLCDVPIGCFLSSGIDSSLVAAVMQSESAAPIHTFTVSFDNPEFDESAQARAIATHLGTRHEQFRLTSEEIVSAVPSLVSCLDEPTANGSFFAVQRISKLARTRATVVLSGDGGDELFAGYNRYRLVRDIWSRLRWTPAPLRSLLRRMLARVDHAGLVGRRGWLMSILPLGSQASAGSVLAKVERLLEAGSYRECYDLVASCWPFSNELARRGKRDRAWWDLPGISSMLLSDQVEYLPGDSLAKLDRASMSVSLETRLPLLDHRIVEFSWRVPANMKLRGHTSKWLMRSVLDRLVPRQLTERKKMGFTVPVDQWLAGPLREWAHEALIGDAFREVMDEEHRVVMDSWNSYRSRGRPLGYQMWSLVVLAAWLRQ